MQVKFRCKSCWLSFSVENPMQHHRDEAYTENDMSCPKCGSDVELRSNF